jgi:mycofactocin biosynthetic radical S-adenosylmethionine protein MftC
MNQPSLPPVLVPQYFGSIIYDPHTAQYFPFDEEATRLFRQMSSTPVSKILQEEPDSDRRKQIQGFYADFNSKGFFSSDQIFKGRILNAQPVRDHLTGPLTLHLEVSDSCNLRCKHCFAGQIQSHGDALTLRELASLFDSMAKIGTFRLGLTGGEPLLRADLFDIIDLAIEKGLVPCLTTNGLLISDEIAKEFGKRKLAWLNVSMEGATPGTHNFIRGKGTYEKVLQKLAVLAKYTRFSLAFTLMRSNLDEARACAELAYQVGAQAAVFRPLYPIGTALQHMELMPTFEEYILALESLSETTQNSLFEFCSVHPWGPDTRSETQSNVYENFGCGAGNIVCSVSMSGDVSPCSFLGPAFNAGNIKDSNLENIWHNSAVFQEMRSLPGNTVCQNCDQFDACGGGCRARALALSGSINDLDPWCMKRIGHEK